MARSSTSFSKENQPQNKGRKPGIKVGSVQVFKYLDAKLYGTDTLEKTTPLSPKHFLQIANIMATMDDTSIASIMNDHSAPKVLRILANELMHSERSIYFIERVMDRTTKSQDTKPEQLQLQFEYKPTQEIENAES